MLVVATPMTHGRAPVATSTMPLSAMSSVALHFARRLTLPPCAQLRSKGPKRRWFHSQRYSRGELRAAAQAAIRIKTVVGSPGTITPMMPSARQHTANAWSSQRRGHGSGRKGGASSSGGSGGCAGMPRIVNAAAAVFTLCCRKPSNGFFFLTRTYLP